MSRRVRGHVVPVLAAVVLAVAMVVGVRFLLESSEGARRQRQLLFDELMPDQIKNCGMERFGARGDGGYLLCASLLENVGAAYSYGIGGRDSWGCAVSRRQEITVHQYDCFNTARPSCPGGSFAFHDECIGEGRETIDGREFDSLGGQIGKNGNEGLNLVVKIDVEGAEWDSLLSVPDPVLGNIDQLVVEFHEVGDERYLDVIKRLKRHFYIVNLHFNNYSCIDGIEPFPAWAFEVLFVNKNIADLDVSGVRPTGPHALDAPNVRDRPDCQA